MKFDILLQNNASKQIFILEGLEPNEGTFALSLTFEDVDMPEGVQDGEYTYAVIRNNRSDVEYDTNQVLLETVVKADGRTLKLADLRPLTGILRIGDIQQTNKYEKDSNKPYYYEG